MKIVKSLPRIKKFGFKTETKEILKEVLKFPSEELQEIALTAILRYSSESKALIQFSPLLKNLVSNRDFKDHLLTLNSKMKNFGDIERQEIVPICNSILFRKIIDKKGTKNFKNFNAIRDFVLMTVSNFNEKELLDLLNTIFCSFGKGLDFNSKVDMNVILRNISLKRIIGLTKLLENIIKNLGDNLSPYIPFLQDFLIKGLGLVQDLIEEGRARESNQFL